MLIRSLWTPTSELRNLCCGTLAVLEILCSPWDRHPHYYRCGNWCPLIGWGADFGPMGVEFLTVSLIRDHFWPSDFSLLHNLPGKSKRGLLVADVNSSRVPGSPGFTGEPHGLSESSFHVPISELDSKLYT